MLETSVTSFILSKSKLYKPGENWRNTVTSVPGKLHPPKPTPHPKYLMDFLEGPKFATVDFSTSPLPGQAPSTFTHSLSLPGFSWWVVLRVMFYLMFDVCLSRQNKVVPEEVFPTFFFQSMAKPWMFVLWCVEKAKHGSVSSLCQQKSPVSELVHKHMAPATAAATASFHCAGKVSLASFHGDCGL